MLTLPTSLQQALASGATTLATCWLLTRKDGVVLGFTDHDADISFADVTYRAARGLDGSAVTEASDLSVGGGDIAGALSDEGLTDEDLLSGRWDGATLSIYLVDWSEPESRVLLCVGTIGEVTRRDGAFRAEVRGPAAALERNVGRAFSRSCDAVFGDARCGIDATSAAYRGEGIVLADASGAGLTLSGFAGYTDGWFAKGVLIFLDGPLAGVEIGVETHTQEDDTATVALWRSLPIAIPAGTQVAMVAGCDKRFETCRDIFANVANFRGFPHIPGNDFAFNYARADGDNDGSVLFE